MSFMRVENAHVNSPQSLYYYVLVAEIFWSRRRTEPANSFSHMPQESSDPRGVLHESCLVTAILAGWITKLSNRWRSIIPGYGLYDDLITILTDVTRDSERQDELSDQHRFYSVLRGPRPFSLRYVGICGAFHYFPGRQAGWVRPKTSGRVYPSNIMSWDGIYNPICVLSMCSICKSIGKSSWTHVSFLGRLAVAYPPYWHK